MKKIVSVVLCAVLFAAVPVLVSADETAKKTVAASQQTMGKETISKQETMGQCSKCEEVKKECCDKCKCPMCRMMMHKCVVATSDGGIVVMIGNKLTKYDKNLNLVKEAEIKIDMEAMKKMCKECSMSEEEEEGPGK